MPAIDVGTMTRGWCRKLSISGSGSCFKASPTHLGRCNFAIELSYPHLAPVLLQLIYLQIFFLDNPKQFDYIISRALAFSVRNVGDSLGGIRNFEGHAALLLVQTPLCNVRRGMDERRGRNERGKWKEGGK